MIELKQVFRRFLSLALALILTLTLLPPMELTVFAAISGDLTGLSNSDIGVSYSSPKDDGTHTSWSASGNSISGSAKDEAGACGNTNYETTLTIKNKKDITAILSFDYTIVQNSGTIQVAGTKVTANGSYSGELAAGDAINIYLKSGNANATTISITKLSLIVDAEATTTFQPAENGSYKVDDKQITAETSETRKSTEPYILEATPDSGYKFMGWYSVKENKYLSSDISATLSFDSSQTITAMFTENTNPVFDVGDAKFTDLNEADSYAVKKGQSRINLVSDGTLPSGSYTVSSGITLLIPFDEQGTCYTTAPATVGNTYSQPKAYRTLTMAEGASIAVDGAISLSAKHSASGNGLNGEVGGGAPVGNYGYIKMSGGSDIIVNSGGALYVWGYISGQGKVHASSGAVVYENMQIRDFRGGSASAGLSSAASGKSFLFNQYFIQNIETKLILDSGADEYIYTSLYASNMSTSTAVHFIGNGGMFAVGEGGTFTKQYLPDKDRLEITVNGDAAINNLTLTIMRMSISSQNYVLPINNYMTLKVLSGTTKLTQDIAFLPGVQVEIAQGAGLEITQNSNLYIYDRDEWMGKNFACGNFKAAWYSPTRSYSRKDADLVDAKVDVNGTLDVKGYIYTTKSGADICSSAGSGEIILAAGAGAKEKAYQVAGAASSLTEIDITSAKLHNGGSYVGTDEEYTETAEAEAGTEYTYRNDKWQVPGKKITVTFAPNGDESSPVEGEMEPQEIVSGEETTLNGNSFVREGWKFTGWNTAADGSGKAYEDESTVILTEDITLYAQWSEETETTYTVTWVNEDGTVLETDENVEYGTTPSYDGETPTKEGDVQYTYTFKGWTPELSEVTEDVTYTAAYNKTTNTYTVTWVNENGTVLETDENAEYGTTPSYDGETPTKEGDAQYTYTFKGWTPEVSAVTGDVTYTAAYEATVNTYTVTWADEDGTVLETDENVEYGVMPAYNGETPTKEADAQNTYSFKGWTPEISEVTGDVTYTAEYTTETNTYTVTWVNADGKVLETDENVTYGTIPTYDGETPTKEGDAQYTYTFKGWTPEVSAITSDVIYRAVYEQIVNTYTITWKNIDETILETDENVEYGTIPTYDGETPVHPEDAQPQLPDESDTGLESNDDANAAEEILEMFDDTNAFSDGADSYAGADVAGISYNDEEVFEDETSFIDIQSFELELDETNAVGSTNIGAANVDETYADETYITESSAAETYGAAPSDEETEPQKPKYRFKGWEPEISEVTGDAVYTATYEEVKETYTVTWVNADGTVLETDENVEYGTIPTYDGETPTKEADVRYTYNFQGWTPEISEVTGNVTYTATYNKIVNTYTVTWENDDGTILKAEKVEYGIIPTYDGESPTKEADVQYTYNFQGWTPEISEVTDDVTYTAVYDKIINTYTVTWENDDGTVLKTDKIKYGDTPSYTGETPVKAGNVIYTYEFTGWTPEISKVTGNATYKALFLPSANNGWVENEGKLYYVVSDAFDPQCLTGICRVPYPDVTYGYEENEADKLDKYYPADGCGTFIFGEDGSLQKDTNGFYTIRSNEINKIYPTGWLTEGATVWTVNGEILWHPGVEKNGNDYYYFASGNIIIKDSDYTITRTNDLITSGKYTFDADGRILMYDGFTVINGKTYYYNKGIKTYAGLIKINESYYYVNSSCEVIKGRDYYVSKTNGLLPAGTYTFGDDGALILEIEGEKRNGIVKENDYIWYYYINGVKTYAGLIEIDGDYYYVNSNFQVIHGRSYFISKTNGLMPQGTYEFDADGKMLQNNVTLNGIVKGTDGIWYYYVNGVKTYAGLIQIDKDYYYVNSSFQVIHGRSYFVSKNNNLLPQATYEFDADGKLMLNHNENGERLNGIVKETDAAWYYYVNGAKIYAGLIQIDGDYYYVNSSFQVIHDCSYFVSKTNGLLPQATYTFDSEGKLITK